MRRIATGLAATIGLALILLGMPALLIAVGPVGLPYVEPTIQGIWQALLRPDDGTIFLTLVKVIGWVTWAILTFSVITEIIARVRHIQVPTLRGLSIPQRLAQSLITAALTLFITMQGSLAQPTDAGHQPSAVAAPLDAPSHRPSPQAEAHRQQFERYTVKKGDTLSQIALDHLGDAHRYPAIYQASKQVRQPGGGHLSDPDVIDIGWKLNIPNGEGREKEARSEGKPDKPKVVATPGVPSPENQSPTPGPERTAPSETTATSSEIDAPTSGEHADQQGEIGYAPGWLLTGLAGAGALLAGGLWLILQRRRAIQHHHRRPGFATSSPPPATAQVEKTLRHQGRPIADLVTFVDETLRRLAAAALDSAGRLPPVIAVEVARSSLTVHVADGTDLPEPWRRLDGVSSWTITTADDPDSIGELEPDGPAPWPHLATLGADDTGHWWLLNLEQFGTLTVTGDVDYTDDLARYVAAELATNPWSRDLEIDLVGVFHEIVGLNPSRCHHHADRAGIDDSLTAAVEMVDRINRTGTVNAPTARVEHADDELWMSRILVARHDQSGHVDELTELVGSMPLLTGTVVLIVDPKGERRTGTELVATSAGRLRIPSLGLDLVGNGLTADEARGCVQLLQAADDLAGAAVPTSAGLQGEPWRQLCDESGRLRDELTSPRNPDGLQGPGVSNIPEPDQSVTGIAATTTEDLAMLAPTVATDTQAAVEQADPSLDADLEAWFAPACDRPRLAVLGAMKVRVAAGQENEDTARRRPYYTELVAYLATRPHGATTEEICKAFDTNPGRVRRDLATVRKWLGNDRASGESYLPAATQETGRDGHTTGRYRLSGLLYDADLLRRLRVRGQVRGPEGVDDFMKAMSLVGGTPYGDIRDRGGIWLTDDRDDQHLLVAIVDAAHLAASMAMRSGDYAKAKRAAEIAMKAAPHEEMPKLDLAAAAAAQGKLRESAEVAQAVTKQRDVDGPLTLDRRTTEMLLAHGWTAPSARTG